MDKFVEFASSFIIGLVILIIIGTCAYFGCAFITSLGDPARFCQFFAYHPAKDIPAMCLKYFN